MRDKVEIMAILNITPDSLWNRYVNTSEVDLENIIIEMLNEGADIIDIGGESTGPGSVDVLIDEEWNRLELALKILNRVRENSDRQFKISLDTYKAVILERALKYGVDILNDITALRGDTKMVDLVAKSGIEVSLMYASTKLNASGNIERTNNDIIEYEDVIKFICYFLEERIKFAMAHGVAKDKIILDPGMGAFISGNHKYSFEVLDRLNELQDYFYGHRILIGASRKGFTGFIEGSNEILPVQDRLEKSLEAATTAIYNGVNILRVHDVGKTKALIDSLNYS